MKHVSWREAFDVGVNYQHENKVTLIMFVDESCDVCNEFVPKLATIENDQYQVLLVSDGHSMPFTPTSYPTGYVFIPNCPTQMPLQRLGGAPIDVLLADSRKQIEAFVTGCDYYDIK